MPRSGWPVRARSSALRSRSAKAGRDFFSYNESGLPGYYNRVYSGGGTGRHAGLKILFAVMRVTVQFRSRVQLQPIIMVGFFIWYNIGTAFCDYYILFLKEKILFLLAYTSAIVMFNDRLLFPTPVFPIQ